MDISHIRHALFWLFPSVVFGQLDSGQVTGTVNFLDAGLTALGALSGFITTLARGVLTAECPQREYVYVQDLFLNYKNRPFCMANGGDYDVMFSVVAPESAISSAKAIIRWISTSRQLRGEVVLVERKDPAGCSCLRLASQTKLARELKDKFPAYVMDDGTQFIVFACSKHSPMFGMIFMQQAARTEDWKFVEYLERSYNWQPDTELLLVPLPSLNTNAVDSALQEACASRDEDARGDLQPLLRTLEEGDARYKGQRQSTAKLTSSIHYLGLVEVMVAVFLVVLFRVDTLSAFLVARRATSSFMTGKTGKSLHAGWYFSKVELVQWQEGGSNIYVLSPLAGFVSLVKYLHPWITAVATVGAFGAWSVSIAMQWSWQFSVNYSLDYHLTTVVGYSILLLVGSVLSFLEARWQRTKLFVIFKRARPGSWEERANSLWRLLICFLWWIVLAAGLGLVVLGRFEKKWHRKQRAMIGTGYILASCGSWLLWFVAASAREDELILGMPSSIVGTLYYGLAFLYIAIMASVSGPWH